MEMMSGFVNLLGAAACTCQPCRKSEITANTSTPGGRGRGVDGGRSIQPHQPRRRYIRGLWLHIRYIPLYSRFMKINMSFNGKSCKYRQ